MKKGFLLLTSIAALGAITVGAMGFHSVRGSIRAGVGVVPGNAINANGERNALVTSEEAKETVWLTDKGNPVAVSYSKATAGDGIVATFAAGGSISNVDPINGIESFTLSTESTSGTITVDYYSTQWHVGGKILVGTVERTITEAGSIDISPSAYETKPDYFRITFGSQTIVNSVALSYACNGEEHIAFGTSAFSPLGGGHITDKDGASYFDGSGMAMNNLSGVYERKDVDVETLSASHHYRISADLAGTKNTSVTQEHNYGLLVYYADENNYLTLEARYRNWDRPHEIRSIVLSGKIGGVSQEAIGGDAWTDNSKILPAQGFNLTAEVTITKNVSVDFALTGGTYSKNGTFSAAMTQTSQKVGAASYNDVTRLSNWNLEYLAEPEMEIDTDYTKIGSPTIKQYLDGRVVTQGTWKDGFAAKPIQNGSSYSIAADITGGYTEGKHEAYYGFLAYYVDMNNFLLGYIKYSESDRPLEVNQLNCIGKIAGQDRDFIADLWCDGNNAYHDVEKHFKLDVAVTSTQVSINAYMKISSNGYVKSGNWTVNGTDLQPSVQVGLWSSGGTGTYRNIVIA